MDLLGSYSNPSTLSRLRNLLAGQTDNRVSDRPRRGRPKQAQTRLTNDELNVVIAAYQGGLTLAELASSFGADRRTLANRLEQRGASRRARRLSDAQIAEAVTFYTDGWSLARIANRFGLYPQSIRYRLQRAGVALRPRPGWPLNNG